MLVTASKRVLGGDLMSFRVNRPRIVIVILALIALSSTGCGLYTKPSVRTGDSSRVGLAADEQFLFEQNVKAPKQMYVQSSRLLPKVDLNLTPEVQDELDRFLTRDRRTVDGILARGVEKFGEMAKALEDQGVPVELVSVAAVESGLNPRAASPAGAKGMWQFMKSTARVYGLRVERGTDERTDFKRSTEAAARHLRDLFVAFQDWHLALAAYNAGRGSINRLVNRTGGSDFWELARGGHLPGETKRFVPKVIALSLIVNNPDQYGFQGYKAVG
jgi:membrane-bound lytic murein transglycosylase D